MENTKAKEFYLRETGWIEPNEEFDENTWNNTIVEEWENPKSVVELMVKYSNEQTTQLREDNDRLREALIKLLRTAKNYEAGNYSENIHDAYDQAEQLLKK